MRKVKNVIKSEDFDSPYPFVKPNELSDKYAFIEVDMQTGEIDVDYRFGNPVTIDVFNGIVSRLYFCNDCSVDEVKTFVDDNLYRFQEFFDDCEVGYFGTCNLHGKFKTEEEPNFMQYFVESGLIPDYEAYNDYFFEKIERELTSSNKQYVAFPKNTYNETIYTFETQKERDKFINEFRSEVITDEYNGDVRKYRNDPNASDYIEYDDLFEALSNYCETVSDFEDMMQLLD